MLAFAIMYGLKRISPKLPHVLVAVIVTTVISWAVGFEHNRAVHISAITHPRAKELIAKFNTALNAIPPLSEKRTEMINALDEAKRMGDTIAVLDARRDADVIAIKIERHKYGAHVCREEIRGFLFKGVEQLHGMIKFYLVDEIPVGAGGDGPTWRIRVGNKPLKTDALVMMGGGEVIGVIPRGLPSLAVPEINIKIILHLLPFAAIISLLGFMEAISIARAMSAKTGQRLDPNQELIGQGLANICGSLGKSYPISGSFSRSALNLQSGAVTGLSSVFTGLAVIIVLLFFTPFLYHMPQSVLAAVIMMAVVRLVNIFGFIHAWKAQWYDGVILIITLISTLVFAPHLEKGIMIGVVLSLLVFLYKSMRPAVPSLSMFADEALHDSAAFGLKECEYIAVVRFDGPLFFANASYLEDQIIRRRRTMKNLKHIHIVSNGINDMDASGEEALSLIVDRVRSAGLDISLSGVNHFVMNVLKKTHLLEKIGEDHIYPTMEKAIGVFHEQTHRDGREETCPLITVCRLA